MRECACCHRLIRIQRTNLPTAIVGLLNPADCSVLTHIKLIDEGTAVALLNTHLLFQLSCMVCDIPLILKTEYTVMIVSVKSYQFTRIFKNDLLKSKRSKR